MDVIQFMKHMEERRKNPLIVGICGYCKKSINEQQAGITVEQGEKAQAILYHRDCYWEAFGDLVEQHPIGAGRIGGRGSNLDSSDLEVARAK